MMALIAIIVLSLLQNSFLCACTNLANRINLLIVCDNLMEPLRLLRGTFDVLIYFAYIDNDTIISMLNVHEQKSYNDQPCGTNEHTTSTIIFVRYACKWQRYGALPNGFEIMKTFFTYWINIGNLIFLTYKEDTVVCRNNKELYMYNLWYVMVIIIQLYSAILCL